MAVFKVDKVVSALPGTLVANTIYAVRVGAGFDLYFTDNTGAVAHTINNARLDTSQSFTKAQGVQPVALTDAATINTDASLSNIFTVTLAGNRTLANPTNLVAGRYYTWVIKQDATGGRTLAYGSAFDFGSAGTPVLTTTPNKTGMITAYYDGTSLLATHWKAS